MIFFRKIFLKKNFILICFFLILVSIGNFSYAVIMINFSDDKKHLNIDEYIKNLPFQKVGHRKFSGNKVVIDEPILINDNKISTQSAFGKILDSYAKNNTELPKEL